MEREGMHVSDIAQELTDRLRFSHVVLEQTKADLTAAKRAAEKKKEKSQRRIQSQAAASVSLNEANRLEFSKKIANCISESTRMDNAKSRS